MLRCLIKLPFCSWCWELPGACCWLSVATHKADWEQPICCGKASCCLGRYLEPPPCELVVKIKLKAVTGCVTANNRQSQP